MYERFTDRARKVLQLANQEAQRFDHEYVGTEHVLLGLIKEGNGVGANVLKKLGVNLQETPVEVEKIVQAGPDVVTKAKIVIEDAIDEARKLNHKYVGTEYLLLGLVRERETVAGEALSRLGLEVETVRAEVEALLRNGK